MTTKRTFYFLKRYFIIGFTCLLVASCDTGEPVIIAPTEITPVIKTEAVKPVLNLSLDNVSIEQQKVEKNELVEKSSALFETLNKKQVESEISVSGTLLTDKNKDENEDYLKSVDGAKIIIKGNFD